MEAWSASPMRVAAVLVVGDGAPDDRGELRVVGRISLVVRGGPGVGAAVEVSAAQSLPDGDDLDFLEPGDVNFTLPPNRAAARRIAGRHLADGTLFAFGGAPGPLAKLRLPALRPRLFLTSSAGLAAGGAAREAPWSLGNVSLDVVDRTISVSFRARVPGAARDGVDLAVVWLDDGSLDSATPEPRRFGELLASTRRLDPAFVQQRARVERRAVGLELLGAPQQFAADRPSLVAAARPLLVEDETASMVAAELDAAIATAPVALHEPVSAPPRRSIGEILSLDPRRARPPVTIAPSAAGPDPDVERALERIFAAPDAGGRVRARFPDMVKPLKRSQDVEVQDRRAVAVVAREAPRVRVDALLQALAGAVDASLLSSDAVVVVSAELVVALEPEPALRALVAAAATLARGSALPQDAQRALTKIVDEVGARTAAPGAPALARLDQELAALRERVSRTVGADAARELEDAAFARLCAARRVRQIPILGELHALLHAEGVPVYVPAAALAELPLQPSFRARIIGAPRPRYDELEASPVALVAIALFREIFL